MKIGDKVVCVGGGYPFTIGDEYEIKGFDRDGDIHIVDDDGDLSEYIGYPLNGGLWQFEAVKND